ncbi:MAG TPA: AMP-binding protein, partial [Methylomirabilota bacterium]|nr:AMP-binding protein [Methylomirabilota bacterium]
MRTTVARIGGARMGLADRLRCDWVYFTSVRRMLRRVRPVVRDKSRIWPEEVARLAARFGPRPALISDRETLTYAEFHARGNRYARWARSVCLGKGETVALLMENRPEYLAIWLGVTRAGGAVALLNTGLTGVSLAHCINTVKATHVIVSAELETAFATAEPLLSCGPRVWSHGEGGHERIDVAVAGFSDADLSPDEKPALTTKDRCLFIFTSGTTGLPKAANINHYRTHAMMQAFSAAAEAGADDRMYVALPLYHTSGGVLAAGAALTAGASAFIREKFSASQFWDDVVGHGCTLFQYIGE